MPERVQSKGQIGVAAAFITGVFLLGSSVFTSWATASSAINDVKSKVQVVEERENNHYLEVKNALERIEKKIDQSIVNTAATLKNSSTRP